MGAGAVVGMAAWLVAAAASAAVPGRGPAPEDCDTGCVADPGVRVAGDDEACWTAGGGMVARRARRGGSAEMRPLALLRGARVDAMAVHRGTVWLGLSAIRGGAIAPLGLVRYDWARDHAHAFRGTDAGPCGFFVHDLLVHEETLWVATELGVSRLRLSPDTWDEWTHFGPAPEDEQGDAETACATLLTASADARWLAEFRPRLWKRLSRRKR